MNKIVLLILPFLLFSCSQHKREIEHGVLTQSEMIDALVDIHLLESAWELNMLEGSKDDSLKINEYYHATFASKSYSLEEFKLSFDFYSKEPKTMELLLDSVLTRIQMME